jgi:hypothetical protein
MHPIALVCFMQVPTLLGSALFFELARRGWEFGLMDVIDGYGEAYCTAFLACSERKQI